MDDANTARTNRQGGDGLALIMQLAFSHVPAQVVVSAARLRLFAHVGAAGGTASEVAGRAATSERGTRMLLDALVALGLLTKSGGRYNLTPTAAEHLVAESPNYVGAMWEMPGWLESWNDLPEVVRTGSPVNSIEDQATAEQFFPALVRSLHVMNMEPARRAAEAMGAAAEGLRVLDVACGSGVWGIPFAEANPRTRVTAQDFGGLFDVTREYVARHGVESQYEYLAGDLKEVDFGENSYDLALLGNIVHSEGERSSRDLFKRLHRALRTPGRLLVMDMVPDDARTSPPFPLFFALNMLLHTREGDTYTLAEYADWLDAAGFARVATADIGSHSPLIVAHKE